MTAADTVSTTVPHSDIVLHRHGAGESAVVFVHGFLDDAHTWDSTIAALSHPGFECVTLDLAGCGERATALGPFTFDRFAADVCAALDSIGKPVVLVGHSMGAPVTEIVAASRPEQTRGLALITPIPLRGIGLPAEAVEPFRRLGEHGPEANRALRRNLAPSTLDAELDRIVAVDRAVRPEVVAALADCWNHGHPAARRPAGYAGPVLVIRGGKDGLITADIAAITSARYPGARTAVLEHAAHSPHVESPSALAAQLDRLLTHAGDDTAAANGWTRAFADKAAESFAGEFAQDVVLEASVLRRPIIGHEQVTTAMAAASQVYESLVFTEECAYRDHRYLEWRATAFGDLPLSGVTVLTVDSDGRIVHAAIHHRPLDAALRFSTELRRKLTGVLEHDYFYGTD